MFHSESGSRKKEEKTESIRRKKRSSAGSGESNKKAKNLRVQEGEAELANEFRGWYTARSKQEVCTLGLTMSILCTTALY